ncbi:hypothetical protein MBAV_003491, partial [Candidatus Magnetobacterium bavaricum]
KGVKKRFYRNFCLVDSTTLNRGLCVSIKKVGSCVVIVIGNHTYRKEKDMNSLVKTLSVS